MGVELADTFVCVGSHGNSTEKVLSGGVYRCQSLFGIGSAEPDFGGVIPQEKKQVNVIKLERMNSNFILGNTVTHFFCRRNHRFAVGIDTR
jgi:hypothetical protein